VGQRGSLPPTKPSANTSLTCGRAGVREDVGIALLQRVGGEAPVALSAACAAERGGVQQQLSATDPKRQRAHATCALPHVGLFARQSARLPSTIHHQVSCQQPA
jgi:hypothetical protein